MDNRFTPPDRLPNDSQNLKLYYNLNKPDLLSSNFALSPKKDSMNEISSQYQNCKSISHLTPLKPSNLDLNSTDTNKFAFKAHQKPFLLGKKKFDQALLDSFCGLGKDVDPTDLRLKREILLHLSKVKFLNCIKEQAKSDKKSQTDSKTKHCFSKIQTIIRFKNRTKTSFPKSRFSNLDCISTTKRVKTENTLPTSTNPPKTQNRPYPPSFQKTKLNHLSGPTQNSHPPNLKCLKITGNILLHLSFTKSQESCTV